MKRPRSTQPASDTEMLITERDRIDHSHSIADSVLETAYATRNEFGRQRQTLTRLNQRLMQSASTYKSLYKTDYRPTTWYQHDYWKNKYSKEEGQCDYCGVDKYVYIWIDYVSLNDFHLLGGKGL